VVAWHTAFALPRLAVFGQEEIYFVTRLSPVGNLTGTWLRPPPTNFPPDVVIRFDVQEETEPVLTQ
jgi:hypothetical protein